MIFWVGSSARNWAMDAIQSRLRNTCCMRDASTAISYMISERYVALNLLGKEGIVEIGSTTRQQVRCSRQSPSCSCVVWQCRRCRYFSMGNSSWGVQSSTQRRFPGVYRQCISDQSASAAPASDSSRVEICSQVNLGRFDSEQTCGWFSPPVILGCFLVIPVQERL